MPVAVTHLYVRGRGSATRLILMFVSYRVFFGFSFRYIHGIGYVDA